MRIIKDLIRSHWCIDVIINTRKAKVNRQLRKANPRSGPDPKREIIIFSVPIERISSNLQVLWINYSDNILYISRVMSRYGVMLCLHDVIASWRKLQEMCVINLKCFELFLSSIFKNRLSDKCIFMKISLVTCSDDLVGQGRLTTILTISISEKTVHVTELILISSNWSALENSETKNNHLSITPNDWNRNGQFSGQATFTNKVIGARDIAYFDSMNLSIHKMLETN